jgi:hypothetical protein
MKVLIATLRECFSLFVDDGSLAATVIVWIVLCALLFRLLPANSWQGPILFIGLALILIENAVRGARSRSG